MTSSDEEMYHGDYSNEEHAESLEYTYDQDPGDAEQGYSEGEDEDEYGEESHSDHHDNDSEDDGDHHSSSDVDHNPPATAPSLEPYEPTVSDILQVRRFFTLIPVPLPEELVDTILDYASYWGHCSLTLTGIASVMGGSKMYMRTLPLAFPHAEGDFVVSNEELHGASTQSGRLVTRSDLSGTRLRTCPCRKIEFQLWSHEQIWILQTPPPEDPEAYRSSRTWFDACIESPSLSSQGTTVDWPAYLCTGTLPDLQQLPVSFVPRVMEEGSPESAFSQVQEHLLRTASHYQVTWDYLDCVEQDSQATRVAEYQGQDQKVLDGNSVKRMQHGDCIALWMRSRYANWECKIEEAKITVHWLFER